MIPRCSSWKTNPSVFVRGRCFRGDSFCTCVRSVCSFHCCIRTRFVLHGNSPYPGAVFAVRSQVFISLDSGRRITRPQAAKHPSCRGHPKTDFSMDYSFPCFYKPHFFFCFTLLSLVFVYCGGSSMKHFNVCLFGDTAVQTGTLTFFYIAPSPSCSAVGFPTVLYLLPQVCLFMCVEDCDSGTPLQGFTINCRRFLYL